MPGAQSKSRVVIDTNLVLSALVFSQGRLSPQRLAWQGKKGQPLQQ
jgi:predicted nucleic acid-binding protein